MITSKTPSTWQDLQQQSARILAECGFDVEVEKVVKLVRGKAEIDVYAEESLKGRKYIILCECKHWKAAVPQTVVHSFRSVMADVGAHKGYIISSSGFQSGSRDAAELTNVELATWDQFQDAFEASWLENCFTPMMTAKLDPLMSYSEPFLPQWFPHMSESDQKEFLSLKEGYDPLGWFAMSLSSYTRQLRAGYPSLPLKDLPDPTGKFNGLPTEIMNAKGYRDLLDACLQHGELAIAKFRAIRDRNNQTGGE
ncbi:restriction endonuclease [Bradyrhizobium barranii]|uniref:Restriction endonuclease n=1 Tax=Bradyrhizobium barranii TaxID=2992140 RepID=A0ABY3QWX3_9BRAD|nr:restriction endonuclease [Bradyrhizobium japonicum]UFW90480.1 restriction endonuclease [Bradyrhizobium japonicum]